MNWFKLAGTLRLAKRYQLTLQAYGSTYPFDLYQRELDLGDGLTVSYYWMDASRFRVARTDRLLKLDNVDYAVCLWWDWLRDKRRIAGVPITDSDLSAMLLTSAYRIFSGEDSQQRVFRDSFLGKAGQKSDLDPTVNPDSLSDEVRQRVQSIVDARDRRLVAKAIENLLQGSEARAWTADSSRFFQSVLDLFLADGIADVRAQQSSGAERFLGALDDWVREKRRNSRQKWLRPFLNWFGVICKTNFYFAYHIAWTHIVPELRARGLIDEISERFLGLWHCQNQPTQNADGTMQDDFFRGHVLALHPLSGILMSDRSSLVAAGQYFSISEPKPESREHWGLIGAILSAAELYAQAVDRPRGSDAHLSNDLAVAANDEVDIQSCLTDYLKAIAVRCQQCHGDLECVGVPATNENAPTFSVGTRCQDCRLQTRQDLDSQTFKDWILESR